MQLTINLTSGNKGRHNFPSPLDEFSSLSYHESNLALSARETMLLINHWLINSLFQSRYSLSASLFNKFVIKDLKVTSPHYFFDVKKQRPNMNLEKCYQCSVIFKFLWTSGISLVIEIFAP